MFGCDVKWRIFEFLSTLVDFLAFTDQNSN